MSAETPAVGRRAFLHLAAGAAVAALASACGGGPPPPTATPQRFISQTRTAVDQGFVLATAAGVATGARPPTDLRGKLTLAGINYAPMPAPDGARQLADNQEILAYLRAAMLIPVVGKAAPTYAATLNALREKSVDVAMLSPLAYILARDTAGVQPLVQGEQADGRPTASRAFLVTTADNPIRMLVELKGKTIAFTDQSALAGYLAPAYSLATKANLRPNVDYTPRFLGSPAAVYQAVQAKQADAGAIDSDAFDQAVATGAINKDALHVVDTSFDIPGGIVVGRDSLQAADVQTLTALFITLSDQPRDSGVYISYIVGPPNGKGNFGGPTVKIRKADDTAYAELRKIPQILGLDVRTLAP